MSAQEPPALPGEVWRGKDDGGVEVAVTVGDGRLVVWNRWPGREPAALDDGWVVNPAPDSKTLILYAEAMRARADKWEQATEEEAEAAGRAMGEVLNLRHRVTDLERALARYRAADRAQKDTV